MNRPPPARLRTVRGTAAALLAAVPLVSPAGCGPRKPDAPPPTVAPAADQVPAPPTVAANPAPSAPPRAAVVPQGRAAKGEPAAPPKQNGNPPPAVVAEPATADKAVEFLHTGTRKVFSIHLAKAEGMMELMSREERETAVIWLADAKAGKGDWPKGEAVLLLTPMAPLVRADRMVRAVDDPTFRVAANEFWARSPRSRTQDAITDLLSKWSEMRGTERATVLGDLLDRRPAGELSTKARDRLLEVFGPDVLVNTAPIGVPDPRAAVAPARPVTPAPSPPPPRVNPDPTGELSGWGRATDIRFVDAGKPGPGRLPAAPAKPAPPPVAVLKPAYPIPLATNTDVLNLWLTAVEKRNDRAMAAMRDAGNVVLVTTDTAVAVSDRAGRFAYVIPEAGPHAGRTFAVEARHLPAK